MTSGQQTINLSVVIVSWNTRAYLERCLNSVREEVRRAAISSEIIVVDNASTDGTIDSVRNRFPDVTFVPLKKNVGFAAATNIGIRQSSGCDLLLLNPDTVLRPGTVDILLRTLYMMPHVGMVSGLLLNPDGSKQSSGYRFPGLIQTLFDFFPPHPRLIASGVNGRVSPGDGSSPYEVDHPLGACMLVRREVVDLAGLLDERYFMYSEEIDWCKRIRNAGWSVLIAPAAKIVHFGGQSTRQMPEEMFLELHRSRARYFQRFESRRFLRVVSLMARTAAFRKRAQLPGNAFDGRCDPESLKAVARIYQEACGSDA